MDIQDKTESPLIVLKVLNNSSVMVGSNQGEKILIGKGIGFGLKPGQLFREQPRYEMVFSVEKPEAMSKYQQLVSQVDQEILDLCQEVVQLIVRELNEKLDENIHVALTDHIQFMLKRLRDGQEISNPFLIEISALYEREFAIADQAIELLRDKTGLDIPDEETGFIALHIYSARGKASLSQSIKFAFMCNSIAEIVEDALGFEIDKKSIDYSRFVTHLRFALQRLMIGKPIKNVLISEIQSKLAQYYTVALEVKKVVDEELNLEVNEDEVGYIAIHIGRLYEASIHE